MLITKRLDELMPDEFTRILSPEKGSALDAKTVVLGSQEHACCSLNAGTLDIKASREFSNTAQKAYVRAKVNAPAQKAGWGGCASSGRQYTDRTGTDTQSHRSDRYHQCNAD